MHKIQEKTNGQKVNELGIAVMHAEAEKDYAKALVISDQALKLVDEEIEHYQNILSIRLTKLFILDHQVKFLDLQGRQDEAKETCKKIISLAEETEKIKGDPSQESDPIESRKKILVVKKRAEEDLKRLEQEEKDALVRVVRKENINKEGNAAVNIYEEAKILILLRQFGEATRKLETAEEIIEIAIQKEPENIAVLKLYILIERELSHIYHFTKGRDAAESAAQKTLAIIRKLRGFNPKQSEARGLEELKAVIQMEQKSRQDASKAESQIQKINRMCEESSAAINYGYPEHGIRLARKTLGLVSKLREKEPENLVAYLPEIGLHYLIMLNAEDGQEKRGSRERLIKAVEELKGKPSYAKFVSEFPQLTGVLVSFTKEAVDRLSALSGSAEKQKDEA